MYHGATDVLTPVPPTNYHARHHIHSSPWSTPWSCGQRPSAVHAQLDRGLSHRLLRGGRESAGKSSRVMRERTGAAFVGQPGGWSHWDPATRASPYLGLTDGAHGRDGSAQQQGQDWGSKAAPIGIMRRQRPSVKLLASPTTPTPQSLRQPVHPHRITPLLTSTARPRSSASRASTFDSRSCGATRASVASTLRAPGLWQLRMLEASTRCTHTCSPARSAATAESR